MGKYDRPVPEDGILARWERADYPYETSEWMSLGATDEGVRWHEDIAAPGRVRRLLACGRFWRRQS